jgi:adenine-specific DNA-methyltransferase
MYEIDKTLKLSCLLPNSYKESIVYKDFLSETINCKYNTIIGNPPYVKKQGSNLYISFIEKCFGLLKDKGELIFIVPSNFIRLTSSKNLINKMLEEGAFTHILHPNIENLFEGAYIDVIVFRYCKDKSLYGSNILFNDEEKRVVAVEGILTFEPLNQGEPEFLRGTDTCGGASDRVDFHNTETLDQYFDIFVGMVTGRDSVFKDPANQVE